MGIEEEYQKLRDAIEEAERSTQDTMKRGWMWKQGMKEFYEGMACGYRYCLALLDIWRPRIVGMEESEE